MNKKHWKAKNYIKKNLFNSSLKSLRASNINIYSSNNVIVFDKQLNYKKKLSRTTRNFHWKKQFNNKDEIISNNEKKNIVVVIINNVDKKVFVIKFENVELHDEKNYIINLSRRTKKRVSNATSDTYEKENFNVNNASKIDEKKIEIRTRIDDETIIYTKENFN